MKFIYLLRNYLLNTLDAFIILLFSNLPKFIRVYITRLLVVRLIKKVRDVETE